MNRETWRLFKEHEGDIKEHVESIKRVKDAWRMANGCYVVHPYYYCNPGTWPQIYSKLRRATDGHGSLVEVLQPFRFTLRMIHGACNNFSTCWIITNVSNISIQLVHSKVHAERCRKMQNASTALADYHRLPQGFSRLLF